MYIRQIKYFLTLLEVGSFRRAAEILSISQPALSNSIKSLEAHYGVQLVERGPLGVRATDFGRSISGFLKAALDSVERGGKEIELIKGGARGHLAVGASSGLIEHLIPDVLAVMMNKRRTVNFTVQYGFLDVLLGALVGGHLDVLVTNYWPTANITADLVVKKFAELSMSIYCRREHPLARKRTINLEDLSKARWIISESTGMRTFLQEIFGADWRGQVERPIIHSYAPFMIRMLTKMDLVSMVPDYTVADLVENGRLKRLALPGFLPALTAGVIYQGGRHMTPALKTFIELAHEVGARRYGAALAGGRAAFASRLNTER